MDNKKYCFECGAEIEANSKFCEYCGTRVAKEKEEVKEKQPQLAMIAEDIFFIYGRGTVVCGMAQSHFGVGDLVENQRTHQCYTIEGIEKFRQIAKEVNPRDNCGLVFRADKSEFKRGDPLTLK